MQIFLMQLLCSVFLTPPFNQVDSMRSSFQLILAHVYEFLIQILPTLMNHLLMKSFSVENHTLDQMSLSHFSSLVKFYTTHSDFKKYFSIFIFVLLNFFESDCIPIHFKILCNTFLTEILLYTGLCCICWNI